MRTNQEGKEKSQDDSCASGLEAVQIGKDGQKVLPEMVGKTPGKSCTQYHIWYYV